MYFIDIFMLLILEVNSLVEGDINIVKSLVVFI